MRYIRKLIVSGCGPLLAGLAALMLLVGSHCTAFAAWTADQQYGVADETQGPGGSGAYGTYANSSDGPPSGLWTSDIYRQYTWTGGGTPIQLNVTLTLTADCSNTGGTGNADALAVGVNFQAHAWTVAPANLSDIQGDGTWISQSTLLSGWTDCLATSSTGQSTSAWADVVWDDP
jgi:hypothetical protein